VNHAGFDDAEKNSFDNGCHYQKGRECKCMNTGFWWCQKYNQTRLFQQTFKVKKTEVASRLI